MKPIKKLEHFNLPAAARHIELIHGTRDGWNTPVMIQVISDLTASHREVESKTWELGFDFKPKDPMARVLKGTLKNLAPQLQALNQQGAAIFIAVNEITGSRRIAANVTKIRAVFIDGDSDKFTGSLKLEPSFTTRRGSNFHAYFLVNDLPVEEFKPQQRAIAKAHTTDPVVDPSRVLRLAGFYHCKGEPEMVTLEEPETSVNHSRVEIRQEYPLEIQKPAVTPTTPKTVTNLDDFALTQKMLEKPNVSRLWNGDLSGHGNDHSLADFALVGHLIWWTNGDAVRTDNLFRSSALMRPKWDERRGDEGTYGQRTITRALENFDGRGYNPNHHAPAPSTRPDTQTIESVTRVWTSDDIYLQGNNVINQLTNHPASRKAFLDMWHRVCWGLADRVTGMTDKALIVNLGMQRELATLWYIKEADLIPRLQALEKTGLIGKLQKTGSGKSASWELHLPLNPKTLPAFQLEIKELLPLTPTSQRINAKAKERNAVKTAPIGRLYKDRVTTITSRCSTLRRASLTARAIMELGKCDIHALMKRSGLSRRTTNLHLKLLQTEGIITREGKTFQSTMNFKTYEAEIHAEMEATTSVRKRSRVQWLERSRQLRALSASIRFYRGVRASHHISAARAESRARFYLSLVDRLDTGESVYDVLRVKA